MFKVPDRQVALEILNYYRSAVTFETRDIDTPDLGVLAVASLVFEWKVSICPHPIAALLMSVSGRCFFREGGSLYYKAPNGRHLVVATLRENTFAYPLTMLGSRDQVERINFLAVAQAVEEHTASTILDNEGVQPTWTPWAKSFQQRLDAGAFSQIL